MIPNPLNWFIDLFYQLIHQRAAETDLERLQMLCALLLAFAILYFAGRFINGVINLAIDFWLSGAEEEKPKREKRKNDQPLNREGDWINPALLEPKDGDIVYVDFPVEERLMK